MLWEIDKLELVNLTFDTFDSVLHSRNNGFCRRSIEKEIFHPCLDKLMRILRQNIIYKARSLLFLNSAPILGQAQSLCWLKIKWIEPVAQTADFNQKRLQNSPRWMINVNGAFVQICDTSYHCRSGLPYLLMCIQVWTRVMWALWVSSCLGLEVRDSARSKCNWLASSPCLSTIQLSLASAKFQTFLLIHTVIFCPLLQKTFHEVEMMEDCLVLKYLQVDIVSMKTHVTLEIKEGLVRQVEYCSGVACILWYSACICNGPNLTWLTYGILEELHQYWYNNVQMNYPWSSLFVQDSPMIWQGALILNYTPLGVCLLMNVNPWTDIICKGVGMSSGIVMCFVRPGSLLNIASRSRPWLRSHVRSISGKQDFAANKCIITLRADVGCHWWYLLKLVYLLLAESIKPDLSQILDWKDWTSMLWFDSKVYQKVGLWLCFVN